VAAARERQARRAGRLGLSVQVNARLTDNDLALVLPPGRGVRGILHGAAGHAGSDPGDTHRVLRVALTLADLEGVDDVQERHAMEAAELADPDGIGLGPVPRP
jgi:predicted ATPase with chaperone activity